MRNKILAGLTLAAAAFTAPAHAEDWNQNMSACAAAAEAQGVVTAGEYRTKFLTGSGGSMKRIALELIPDNGETIQAECKVKRGKVKELTIKV